MSLPKSKQPKNNKSYAGLVSVVSDPLLCAKFKFVEMLSSKFNKFLRGFQTDYPMVPFLYSALEDLLRWLMGTFVLEETLAKADSGRKRLKINPQDVNIRKSADHVDVGSAAKLLISEYKKKSTYKESTVLNFRKEVSVLLATLTSHFMEKSPIKSAVARFVICFDPNYMANSQDSAIKAFGLLCEKLLTLKRLPSTKYVEEAKEQYQSFIKHVVTAEFDKFDSFDRFKQRVDEFLGAFLAEKTYCNVYDLLKLVCTLSHGQSSIERGFSINKEHLVENLQEESLIALRIINDHMFANNLTPININISKKNDDECQICKTALHGCIGRSYRLLI